jgi:Reverse transcriptase (RNA-dependent DNA polymerase)
LSLSLNVGKLQKQIQKKNNHATRAQGPQKEQNRKLVSLIPDEKVVGCKWVFIVKQNPEGLVECYKARLIVKGYNQTYHIDYDETFTPVAKMSTVRTLIFTKVNGG